MSLAMAVPRTNRRFRPAPMVRKAPASPGDTLALLQRLGCSPAEALRTARKLAQYAPVHPQASASCISLRQRLDLSEQELKRVVLKMPSLLNLCFETHLSPSLAAFQQRLGLSQGELKRLVLFKPQLI
jgi:AraC-like DNA-binding protein